MLVGQVDDEALLDHRASRWYAVERGSAHARAIRSSGTGSGWLARKRSTRSVLVAAGT